MVDYTSMRLTKETKKKIKIYVIDNDLKTEEEAVEKLLEENNNG